MFVFEKKILEKMEKRSSELVLEAMKAGPTHLARLRHPRLPARGLHRHVP